MRRETQGDDFERKATRELASLLVKESSEWLSAIESAGKQSKLTPSECFRLWYDLGELEFDDWSTLLLAEKNDLQTKASQLEARLRVILASGYKAFLTCLEQGILATLIDMKRAHQRIIGLLAEGKLVTTLPSIEINSDLLSWRDYLGFVEFLLMKMGVDLNPQVLAKINEFDGEMKNTLPHVIKSYRNMNDDPTPHPDRFPMSFWWRQIT